MTQLLEKTFVEAAKGNQKAGKGGVCPIQDRPILS